MAHAPLECSAGPSCAACPCMQGWAAWQSWHLCDGNPVCSSSLFPLTCPEWRELCSSCQSPGGELSPSPTPHSVSAPGTGECPKGSLPCGLFPFPSAHGKRAAEPDSAAGWWLQHQVTMQCCGSSGAQLQGWTHAWIPHPCTTWHHMEHDWAQGRTHTLQPPSPHKVSRPGHPLMATPSTPPKARWAEPRPQLREQQEGQQSPTTCEELLCAWPGCPHAHLGVRQSVCSDPQLLPARNSAAIEGLHWPQSDLSLITEVALGSSPPSQSFRLGDRLFTSSCREAPQRTLNSTQKTCALRAPAPACLCRCDT